MRRLIVLGLVTVALLAPALAAPAAAAPHPQGYTVHVVQPGETLYSIAMRYGVSAAAVAAANNLVNPNFIYIGQRLTIPGSHNPGPPPGQPAPVGGVHIVQAGDTLYSIAWRYGTTVTALMSANGISNPNYIFVGQRLVVGGAPAPAPSPGGEPCGHYHVVVPGETLSGIAAHHGLAWLTLARANGLTYPYMIFSGQRLLIPCTGASGEHHPGPKPGPKPQPTPKPLSPAACPREVQIVQPREGEYIKGTVNFIGTAAIDNFQFYKLEYAVGHTPLDGAFHGINDVYRTKAWDTILGTWYVGNMPDGPYTLRLTAVDNRGQFQRPCNVHVFIDN
jgi:LysM repeat protein